MKYKNIWLWSIVIFTTILLWGWETNRSLQKTRYRSPDYRILTHAPSQLPNFEPFSPREYVRIIRYTPHP